MLLSDLRARVRTKLDDTVAPYYLWQDADLNDYLNEAVQEANLRARLIVDSTTPSVCQFTFDATQVALGTGVITLDPSIIVVRRIEWVPTEAGTYPSALERRSFNEMDRMYRYWRTVTGCRPQVSVHDLQKGTITLHPIPVETGVLNMIVWRHPLSTELMTSDSMAPAIPAQYHRRLVEWACSQAYTHRDPDTEDPNAAAKHLEAFEAEYGQRPTVQMLQRLAVDREPEAEAYYY